MITEIGSGAGGGLFPKKKHWWISSGDGAIPMANWPLTFIAWQIFSAGN